MRKSFMESEVETETEAVVLLVSFCTTEILAAAMRCCTWARPGMEHRSVKVATAAKSKVFNVKLIFGQTKLIGKLVHDG